MTKPHGQWSSLGEQVPPVSRFGAVWVLLEWCEKFVVAAAVGIVQKTEAWRCLSTSSVPHRCQRTCKACLLQLLAVVCPSPLTTVSLFHAEVVQLQRKRNFAAIRSRYFSASSIKDVFENVNAQSVVDFIKEIHFYDDL